MAKIALIYDKFLVHGGGERIFGILLECFPDAEIYALNAYPKSYWETKFKRRIHTTFLLAISYLETASINSMLVKKEIKKAPCLQDARYLVIIYILTIG